MTKRKIESWVIPPKQDGEFVACMEEVLETYEKAYNKAKMLNRTAARLAMSVFQRHLASST